MRKTRKPLIGAMCALVLALGVNATYAWLTDTTETVTNTFTVGNIDIALDESATDEYGVVDESADRKDGSENKKGNSYKLIPGHNYVKDPIVTVKAGSEKCYLFVKVVNGIESLEAEAGNIASQIEANEWTELSEGSGVYWMIADACDATEDLKLGVFEQFTIDETVTATDLQNVNADTFVAVKAFAVQYEGSDSAAAAWEKVPADKK